ncbi:UNVERIFIED_CONTAM: hypothetical protein NCL1_31062 [Trichonephila clavipes]
MHKKENNFVKKKEKLAATPIDKVTKNNTTSSSATAKSPSEYTREYQARKKKTLQNTLLMQTEFKGCECFIETLLMAAEINTDFGNHPVKSTREPSTSLVRVGTDACETIINSILHYKNYEFHKNAWPHMVA